MIVQPAFKTVVKDPRVFMAFGFGSGLSPLMPGTVGTLAAIPLYLIMNHLAWWVYVGIISAAFFFGVHICGYSARKLGVHDHGGIVWDEFVGLWITMLFVPFDWHWLVIGFVLFRFFDMLKPWPISVADKHLRGGFGIMFDDILAGIAASACLHIIIWSL